MTPKTRLKCMKYSTVFGSLLTISPHGLFLIWGNMSIYCLSYIVNILHSTSNVDTPWIISIFFVFYILGLTSSSIIARRIERRQCALAGAIVADIGVFCSYFAVQNSVLALTCTLSIVMGFGVGIIYGSVIQLVVEWADNDVGKLTSLVISGYSVGGVLINEFVTIYINPHNLTPDMKLGRLEYFTQKEILDKVPSMFLLYGGFSVCIHIISLSMLRQKPIEEAQPLGESKKESMDYSALENNQSRAETEPQILSNLDNCISSPKTFEEKTPTIMEKEKILKDYHPKEMLKTSSFYIMWISFVFGNVPFLLLINYYKAFGQLWIHEDHFLTILGTVVAVSNGGMTVLWGVAMDRYGVKDCLVVLISSFIIILTWYFFAPMVNKWMYFVITVLFGCTADSLYPCYVAAIALLYGKTHFSTNLGILMSSAIFLHIVAPYILKSILTHFGWFVLFAFGSGLAFLGLLLILWFIPRL